jgi:hypothetical protein
VLLTRSPLYSSAEADFLVRLACVRHAASVDSEPGSNSRLKPDPPPAEPRTLPSRQAGTALLVRSLEPRPKRLNSNRVPTSRRTGTVRSFNFSRLARSTCCQRPFHLTPERGDSGRSGPKPILEPACSTRPRGPCCKTLQPYRESRRSSTRAPSLSGTRTIFGTAPLDIFPRPYMRPGLLHSAQMQEGANSRWDKALN